MNDLYNEISSDDEEEEETKKEASPSAKVKSEEDIKALDELYNEGKPQEDKPEPDSQLASKLTSWFSQANQAIQPAVDGTLNNLKK